MNRRRRLLFIAITLSVSVGITAVGVEAVLRLHAASLRGGESMSPGLIDYHAQLGWALQPAWQGVHEHVDYRVRYRISRDGFRFSGQASSARQAHSAPQANESEMERIAIVGDSFTFGLGVNDDETFANQLQLLRKERRCEVRNLGVPGYSTDQEVLQLEEQLPRIEPQQVILVVCLINDIFDNERLFPLQAMQGKPRFRLHQGELRLENVPVPMQLKPAANMQSDLSTLVMGDFAARRGMIASRLGSNQIAKRLGWFQPSWSIADAEFEQRFGPGLELFHALVTRARDSVEITGALFHVALLSGRSYVESPDSYSAEYQDFLRRSIASRLESEGVSVIDLAAAMRELYRTAGEIFFHPNDGHLNLTGHRCVAEILASRLGETKFATAGH